MARFTHEDSSWSDEPPSSMQSDRRPWVHAFRNPDSSRPSFSDDRLEAELVQRLLEDWRLDPRGIECTVHDRHVTLGGFVPERKMWSRAEDIAASVRGVRHVENHLRIQPNAAYGT